MSEIINKLDTNEESGSIELMSFPKEVLSRIQPGIVLHRHLQLGLRPKTLMKLDEFRNFEEQSSDSIIAKDSGFADDLMADDNGAEDSLIVASNLLKVGDMFIKTELSLGIAQVDTVNISEDSFAPIWPEVVVDRGRLGAPTDEEMIASRQLYESIISGKYIKQKDMIVSSIGKKEIDNDNISYDVDSDDELLLKNKNKWCYVIYAKICVYSREGPIYDHVFNSLMLALQKVSFPSIYIEESSIDLQIPVKKSFKKQQKQETQRTFTLKFDFDTSKRINLNKEISISSNYGVIYTDPTLNVNAFIQQNTNETDSMDVENDNTNFKREPLLISDISTDIEEQAILSRVSISCNSKNYTSIKLLNGSSNQKLSLQQLKQALLYAKKRYQDVQIKN